MSAQKKRQADGRGLALQNPENRCEVLDQDAMARSSTVLLEFPGDWFWVECAEAQLRILARDSDPRVQGHAIWRYVVCLAFRYRGFTRWTGYAASVLKGHASIPNGALRWRLRYLQEVVDCAEWWVPIVIATASRDAGGRG